MKPTSHAPDTTTRDRNGRSLLETAKSFLFVPGDRPERFPKAMRCDADVVIIDWEASVTPANKQSARENTIAFLNGVDDCKVAIRVNPFDGRDFADDALALREIRERIAGVFLTMVDSGAQLVAAADALPTDLPLVAMIETARGILHVEEITTSNRICRLAFGNMDFQTELELPPEENVGLIYPSSRMIVASRAAGLPAPVSGVTENIADLEVFERSARLERNLGFLGKLCVHPTQLALTNVIFAPSVEEVEWAKRVIAATRNSHAVMLDGRMIDRPVIDRAKNILSRLGTASI
ncbi:CoA ester lyase [Burkholderia sp. Bp9142]|uniref:HpcH/HpaI aldolase/citrate lyase family protein n=1 Tax=Burkholderia sp. Bp9142 TaxID=2184573 RepID=UPI000F59C3F9|nr:CoA ester lyase [Burkholderia sp. Bp9142]RQR26491.1 CoA ester lyase [Burkholderia sp. Bp9142]